jgi:TonB family protein
MRVVAAFAVILASGLAGCAQPPDTFDVTRVEGRPIHTVRAPTAADISNVYPPSAKQRGLMGRVELDCVLNAEGGFTNCRIDREDPPGEGFGAAALRVVPAFREAPVIAGTPMAGWRVRLPITFKVQ